MKKNLLTLVLLGTAAAAAISCSNKDNLEPAASERVPMQFSAGTPAITKTAIAEDGTSVVWSEGDAIGIFDTQINKFDLIAGDGTSEGRFSGFALPDAEYYALYPYDETASIAGGIISATLPSAQYSTADGTFSTILNPAVAKADASNSLAFDHVAAMMKVNVTGVTGDVKSISLSADKSLAGAYTVDMSADTWSAVAAVSEDAAGVTLTGQDGGNLAAGPYYLVVLPGEYGSMTLTVTLADGTTGTYSSKSPLSVAAHDIKEVTVDANDFVSGEFGFEPSEDLRFGYQGTTKTYTVNAPAGTAWTLEADSDDVVLGATEGTGTRSVKVTLPYSKYINDKTYTLTLSADGQASKTLTITQDPFADPVGYPDLSGFTLTAKYGAAYVKSKDYWKYGTFEWTFSNVNLTSGYFGISNRGADGITMIIRFGGDAAVNTVYLKGYLTINGVNVYWGVDRGSSNGGDGDFKNLPCNNVSLGELHSMKLEITPDTRSGYQQNNILNRKLWINDEVVFEFSKTNYPETESARPGDPVDWCGGDIWQSGSTHPGLQYQFGIGGAGKGSITIDSFEYTPYE